MTLSIEFKTGVINLVEAKVRKSSIDIKKVHSFEFPENWVDQSGIIEMDLIEILFEQIFRDLRFTEKTCSICINNSSIIYRELIVPKIDDKKMPLLVRSDMMDALNLTPDYIMDFIILNELDVEGTPSYRLLAVASQSMAIESYITLMKRLKLKLLAIDSATNSVLKIIDTLPSVASKEQVIVADVGSGHLRLYLFEFGQYVLSRNTRLISFNETTQEENIVTIEDNINKMIQYSYTRGNKSGIKDILIFGQDEILNDLKARINEDLLVPCSILESPTFVHWDETFQTKYTNAIGTLVRKV